MTTGTRTMTIDKSNQRVRRMFAAIAPRYDMMNHVLSMNTDRRWRRRTVRVVRPQGTDPILDLCTGTGDLAFAFARAAGDQVPVMAADFCREMLEIGEQKKRRAGTYRQVTFVEADAQHLPFADNSFQIVSVAFGLRNVADTQQGLREMIRVCRPEGKVAVLEFSMPRHQPLRGMYGWYFRYILPRIGQLLARNKEQAYDYLPESVGQFPSGEQLAVIMRDCGLRHVDLYPLTFGVATLYVGVK